MGLGPVFLGPYFLHVVSAYFGWTWRFFPNYDLQFFLEVCSWVHFCMSLHLQIPDIGYTLLRQLCVKLCFVLELKRLVKG